MRDADFNTFFGFGYFFRLAAMQPNAPDAKGTTGAKSFDEVVWQYPGIDSLSAAREADAPSGIG
jgi:hypothetical protein